MRSFLPAPSRHTGNHVLYDPRLAIISLRFRNRPTRNGELQIQSSFDCFNSTYTLPPITCQHIKRGNLAIMKRGSSSCVSCKPARFGIPSSRLLLSGPRGLCPHPSGSTSYSVNRRRSRSEIRPPRQRRHPALRVRPGTTGDVSNAVRQNTRLAGPTVRPPAIQREEEAQVPGLHRLPDVQRFAMQPVPEGQGRDHGSLPACFRRQVAIVSLRCMGSKSRRPAGSQRGQGLRCSH